MAVPDRPDRGPPPCLFRPPAPLAHPPTNPSRRVVGDVQGAVRAHRYAHRPVLRTGAVLMPEAVRERVVRPDRLAVLEGHEHDTIAGLGQRRAVPRTVERDERPIAIPRGELSAAVKH